jgi:hypothetical protein
MIKHKIGKNRLGTIEYLTTEQLKEVADTYDKGKFTNQQWAKIRKLIKKELN